MSRLAKLGTFRLAVHAPAFLVAWLVLSRINTLLDPLWSYYLALTAMYVTAMFGMVILVGLSGQVSLGNGALMAVGGYAFAVTSLRWQTVPGTSIAWTPWWSVAFAALGGVVAGLIIGLVAARLRGPYLAGFTLGVAVAVPALANRFPELLGGNQGLMVSMPYPDATAGPVVDEAARVSVDDAALEAALGGSASTMPTSGASPLATSDLLTMDDVSGSGDLLTPADVLGSGAPVSSPPSVMPSASALADVTSGASSSGAFVVEQWQASVAIAVMCLAGFVAVNLVRGRQGQLWRAVRDDPVAASVVGIAPGPTKVRAFMVSSVFAALAGAVFAQILTYVGPGAYGVGLSLSLLVGVVLGGRSSLAGAVIGAVLLVGFPVLVSSLAGNLGWDEQVANNLPSLAYGLLLVLVVLLAPGGLMGIGQSLWARARKSTQ